MLFLFRLIIDTLLRQDGVLIFDKFVKAYQEVCFHCFSIAGSPPPPKKKKLVELTYVTEEVFRKPEIVQTTGSLKRN